MQWCCILIIQFIFNHFFSQIFFSWAVFKRIKNSHNTFSEFNMTFLFLCFVQITIPNNQILNQQWRKTEKSRAPYHQHVCIKECIYVWKIMLYQDLHEYLMHHLIVLMHQCDKLTLIVSTSFMNTYILNVSHNALCNVWLILYFIQKPTTNVNLFVSFVKWRSVMTNDRAKDKHPMDQVNTLNFNHHVQHYSPATCMRKEDLSLPRW